ncbi:MAG: hypothetical protein II811_08675 [Spirochaetaceae bacterium]|nr:hypothetical protein [Spirochaetaceae bacterium]
MIFSSKTRWFVALLLSATLFFGGCSSDSDDDDDDSSSSSSSSAPSASALAGKMFTTVASASSYSEVEANDDIIMVFNSSGSGGDYYEIDEDTSSWEKLSFSYNSSTGIVSFSQTSLFALVSLPSSIGVYDTDDALGSDLSSVLSGLMGYTVVASGGKITYNGTQIATYTESESVTTVTYSSGAIAGYLVKYSGQYYEILASLYSYSGSLPSVN